jgi:hypothetical protein
MRKFLAVAALVIGLGLAPMVMAQATPSVAGTYDGVSCINYQGTKEPLFMAISINDKQDTMSLTELILEGKDVPLPDFSADMVWTSDRTTFSAIFNKDGESNPLMFQLTVVPNTGLAGNLSVQTETEPVGFKPEPASTTLAAFAAANANICSTNPGTTGNKVALTAFETK